MEGSKVERESVGELRVHLELERVPQADTPLAVCQMQIVVQVQVLVVTAQNAESQVFDFGPEAEVYTESQNSEFRARRSESEFET